ncbi:MAG: response regulator [Fimbriimonadaceae bacterium]|nr:response regulator [Fimbriimonadaceae bacterium]
MRLHYLNTAACCTVMDASAGFGSRDWPPCYDTRDRYSAMIRITTDENASKLILLIEDNTDDERLTLRALRRNNVMNEVIVACDGQEALDYLRGENKFAGRDTTLLPSLILLDLKLPKLSGVEVLRAIRANDATRFTPVVVFTAREDDGQQRECLLAGANSFVLKPSESEEYSERILELVMYWLLVHRAVSTG